MISPVYFAVLIADHLYLHGGWLPTTALYVMLATVAQPALRDSVFRRLQRILFVLYYGVISEITPPVCASAYAAAGIAGANPFKTGLSAFSLGIGKLLVPMVFVYSPAMLIVLDDYFTYARIFPDNATLCSGCVYDFRISRRVFSGFNEWAKPSRVCTSRIAFGVAKCDCKACMHYLLASPVLGHGKFTHAI